MLKENIKKQNSNHTSHFSLRTSNNGITLIALIITIIVMLILVAVTITVAVNGGLFKHAGQAVRETQDAIEAEQRLADGKIKINGKWYASIEDYLNNNPITTGIEINTTTINLKKKESEEVEGEEVLTGTITASVFGMEKEPEITWEITGDTGSFALSGTTGKTITIEAVGTAKATATLTAKCTYEGIEYTATSEVTLKILKAVSLSKGAFVEYGVAYTDAYIGKDYTTTNGWRLLDYTVNEDGTISNVKLISTGIPAKVYYNYSDTSTNKSWWVTTEEASEGHSVPNLTDFKEVLGGSDYYNFYTGTSTYYALQVSAGFYYNFRDIKFKYSTSSRGNNLGYFTSITTTEPGTTKTTTYGENNTEEKQGIDLFKARTDVTDIRLLALPELNTALGRTDIDSTNPMTDPSGATGLFVLQNLKNVAGMSDYTYSSSERYWLASPYPYASNYSNVCDVYYSGSVGNYYHNNSGVRPAVILPSDVHYRVEVETDSETEMDYFILTAE